MAQGPRRGFVSPVARMACHGVFLWAGQCEEGRTGEQRHHGGGSPQGVAVVTQAAGQHHEAVTLRCLSCYGLGAYSGSSTGLLR